MSSDSIDSLVERCIGVFTEIILFSQNLECRQGSPYGYDIACSLQERIDFISRNTRPGKQLSKSSILLVQGVLEALLNKDQLQEKDLKEYLVAKFKQLGLKVSSRSVFGGTSLEVSSVCNILCALGMLEVISSDSIASPCEAAKAENDAVVSLNNYLKLKFESTPFEPSNKSETSMDATSLDAFSHENEVKKSTTSSTDEMLDLDIVDMLMTENGLDQQNDNDTAESSFPHDTHTHAISDINVKDVTIAGEDISLPPAPESMSSSSSRRHYQSGRKFWRLRSSNDISLDFLKLIDNPLSKFREWNNISHSLASTLEIEEKLVRCLCAELDVSLPSEPTRTGTRYMKLSGEKANVASPNLSCRKSTELSDMRTISLCGRDLFQSTKKLTSEYLLDKVQKSKRQKNRTFGGNPGYFSGTFLQSARVASQRSSYGLAAQADQHESAKSKRPRTSSGEFISVGEFISSIYSQSMTASTSSILGGLSSATNVLLAGSQPVVTSSMIRHYAQPHQVVTDISGGYFPEYPIQYPDLAVSTVEVPWRSLVSEFALVVLDESGEFVDGLSNNLLNQAELSWNPHSVMTSADSTTLDKIGKKRSRSSSHLNQDGDSAQEISTHHTLKRKIISEVLAPTVKTLNEVGPDNGHEDSGSDEDTSDEHYLQRHDDVLKTMRDRWALLNRLKHDVRRDNSTPGGSFKKQRTDGERDSSVAYEKSDSFQVDVSLTPPVKKRGRPPKFHKMSS